MRTHRTTLALATTLLSVIALAACVQDPGMPTPTPTATRSSTPSPAPTESSPTPTPNPTPEIIPFAVDCSSLIDPDTMYAFDPNFSPLGAFTPDAGSLAADAQAAGGTVCRWVHDTNGVTIDVSVADLPSDVASSRIATLDAAGSSVGDYGARGYFSVAGGLGQAQAFPSHYWVSIVSPIFAAPGDAGALMGDVTAALP
ncbi:hypothetical protein HDC94_001486 [Leifsonia sp. AK011]|uniref:arginyl-tRNA synthetase n=1 Tax=Leifsonia sp. AK011 TaxID=2723075 RepID=UPI0015C9FB1D|nr:arginyl-tRNA synthetase [Leifsonia sp. AK011]NYF10330.1 hypothetical protein [Leifsonia sp. AK011]